MIIAAENIMGSTRNDENCEPIVQYGHRFGIACFFKSLMMIAINSQVQK